MAQSNAEQIDTRNVLSMDRTVLANERTYAAWLRTGLAALISGLAIAKYTFDILPVTGIRIVAALLIGFSAVIFLISAWRYNHVHLHVKTQHLDVDAVPLYLVRILSLLLGACSLISLSSLWYVSN